VLQTQALISLTVKQLIGLPIACAAAQVKGQWAQFSCRTTALSWRLSALAFRSWTRAWSTGTRWEDLDPTICSDRHDDECSSLCVCSNACNAALAIPGDGPGLSICLKYAQAQILSGRCVRQVQLCIFPNIIEKRGALTHPGGGPGLGMRTQTRILRAVKTDVRIPVCTILICAKHFHGGVPRIHMRLSRLRDTQA
jgi:hypothetical protein